MNHRPKCKVIKLYNGKTLNDLKCSSADFRFKKSWSIKEESINCILLTFTKYALFILLACEWEKQATNEIFTKQKSDIKDCHPK